MDITCTVRNARRHTKLSQAAFAKELGLTKKDIINLESHRFVPLNEEQQAYIANNAGVPLDFFQMIYSRDHDLYGTKEPTLEELVQSIQELPPDVRGRLLPTLQKQIKEAS